MGLTFERRAGRICRVPPSKEPERPQVFMDIMEALRYFGALALVIALVGGAGLAIRRYGLPGIAGGAGRRLSVVEPLMPGKNHRLFIIRCDGTEHVLVTAPQ